MRHLRLVGFEELVDRLTEKVPKRAAILAEAISSRGHRQSRERHEKGTSGLAALTSSGSSTDAVCWHGAAFLEPDPTAAVGVPRVLEGGRNGYQQTGRRQCPERLSPEAHLASQQDHGRKRLDQARQEYEQVHGSEEGAGEEEWLTGKDRRLRKGPQPTASAALI